MLRYRYLITDLGKDEDLALDVRVGRNGESDVLSGSDSDRDIGYDEIFLTNHASGQAYWKLPYAGEEGHRVLVRQRARFVRMSMVHRVVQALLLAILRHFSASPCHAHLFHLRQQYYTYLLTFTYHKLYQHGSDR